ncbi:VOC family protein [Rhizohabitans arisaemae]|uniref:VOC family protein n=1 Tax=Rhizohabitans arisaemae TaxID=2720610 RepID=UPI0024B0413B|nr:VOC family protein [Rhizohabitans arisaemae]
MSGSGLPGLRGVDHIGITVPDLDAACGWLIEVLGCEHLYTLGPYRDDTGNWMNDHLGVHPRAVMEQLRLLRCGDVTLEVFRYAAPDQRREVPRNSDMGGHHIALYVEDLDLALAHLHAHGVEVLGEPTASSGPSEGQRWVYFRAPWGLQMELVSYPNGKAFEREERR